MDNRTSFVFNGKDSRDYHLYIENNVSFPSPEADVELVEVIGRDGEVAIDHERYKGVDFSLPLIVRPPVNVRLDQLATEISDWMKGDVGWKPLYLGERSQYEYVALAHSPFDIQRTIMNFGRTVIRFRLKPYKYRRRQELSKITNGSTLVNYENVEAQPLIRIAGDGDIDLFKNGEPWLSLRSVQGNISIDTELQTVYSGDRMEYKKMLGETGFPTLGRGSNKITWTGAVTKIEMLPRWRSLM